MDQWLDDLAKSSAGGLSRRAVIRRLGAGLAAALIVSLGLNSETKAAPNPPGTPCNCPSGSECVPTGCCPADRVCGPSTNRFCCDSFAYCFRGACTCKTTGGPVCLDKCCAAGKECCVNNGKAVCTSKVADSSNCGECGVECFGETPNCCNGHCTSIAKSNQHCGGCNKSCSSSEICVNGKCVSTQGCGDPNNPNTLVTCKGSITGNATCCKQTDSCCADFYGYASCCPKGCCRDKPLGCCT